MGKGEGLSRAADRCKTKCYRVREGAIAGGRELPKNGRNEGMIKAPAAAAASLGATLTPAAAPAATSHTDLAVAGAVLFGSL